MPAKSAKQYGLMQAAAHGMAGLGGPPQEVGKEFVKKTPGNKRKAFANALKKKKKK